MEIPRRAGPPPTTNPAMPHQQLDQTAPLALQERLHALALALPGVRAARSRVSVPGARAFVLDAPHAPPPATMVGGEFAHLHPPHDGSMHLTLPTPWVREVEEKGWGELHPLAVAGAMPPHTVMVYGPRDDAELDVVARILRASHAFARGEG